MNFLRKFWVRLTCKHEFGEWVENSDWTYMNAPGAPISEERWHQRICKLCGKVEVK